MIKGNAISQVLILDPEQVILENKSPSGCVCVSERKGEGGEGEERGRQGDGGRATLSLGPLPL